jgi:hypothetical protein
MLGGGRTVVASLLVVVMLCGCASPPLRPSGQIALAGSPDRSVALATARGPAAPATTTAAAATCPAGTVVSGGGVATTLIGGGTPPSSLHANGTGPAGPGATAPLGAGGAAARWVALGATGGQIVLGGATTVAAICLRPPPGLGRPRVVAASVPGPAQAATTAMATASCRPGALMLGGGGYATVTHGSASPSLHLIGSYPSDARGTPAAGGSRAPAAWTARADAGGRTGAGVETIAFAICAAAAARRSTTIAVATHPGPLPATSATTATAACPAGTVLVSGGARTGPSTGAPQQGLHLTGSFPSDAGGHPAWSAPAKAVVSSWSARAESGGQGSPGGTATTAFAVCLRP